MISSSSLTKSEYSTLISTNLRSFSKFFSLSLFKTRSCGIPSVYKSKILIIDKQFSSIVLCYYSFFYFSPCFIRIANKYLRPPDSIKGRQLYGVNPNDRTLNACFEYLFLFATKRRMKGTPPSLLNSLFPSSSVIIMYSRFKRLLTNYFSSSLSGICFLYMATDSIRTSTPLKLPKVNRLFLLFCSNSTRISLEIYLLSSIGLQSIL